MTPLTAAGVAALTLLPAAGRAIAADEPPRLLVCGKPVPTRWGTGRESRVVYAPMHPFFGALGARMQRDTNKPAVVYVIADRWWAQLTIGSKRIVVRAGGESRAMTLAAAPMLVAGTLYVPVSAAKAIGIPVSEPDSSGAIRVGEEQQDEVARWCKLLGIKDTAPFRKGGLAVRRVKASLTGRSARVGSEMAVTISLSAPGRVQLYEVRGTAIEPVLGKDEDANVVLYPRGLGKTPEPVEVKGRLRIPMRVTAGGHLDLVVVATTGSPAGDPLEELRAGKSTGSWAIGGTSVEVEEERRSEGGSAR